MVDWEDLHFSEWFYPVIIIIFVVIGLLLFFPCQWLSSCKKCFSGKSEDSQASEASPREEPTSPYRSQNFNQSTTMENLYRLIYRVNTFTDSLDHPTSLTSANRFFNQPPSSTLSTYPDVEAFPSTRRTREFSSDPSQTSTLDLDPQVTERENTMYPTELRVCLPPNQDNSERESMRFNNISLIPNASPGSIDVETPLSLSELRVRLPPITENNSNLSRSSSRISSGTRGRESMSTTPSIQESTTGPEASMSTGSSLGRWLMMSDDRPPDYDKVDSPPTYLEATRGQYSWTRHSLGRDTPTISCDNLEDLRDSIVHF